MLWKEIKNTKYKKSIINHTNSLEKGIGEDTLSNEATKTNTYEEVVDKTTEWIS